MKILLNKNLLNSQQINEETELGIKAVHTMLDLVLDNPGIVGIESVSKVVRGLEFALQKLWNFPQDKNFHRYQFMINGCDCPKMDNEDMFQFGQPYRYYNMECPVHSVKTKKSKESKSSESKESKSSEFSEETRLSSIHKLIKDLESENEEIELMRTLLKMFPK